METKDEKGVIPVKKFSAGAVSATVWERDMTKDGELFKHRWVTFDKRYKDKQANWQSTDSMNVNDIPKLALVLKKAYEYLSLKGVGSDKK